jgi:hypothetical protein
MGRGPHLECHETSSRRRRDRRPVWPQLRAAAQAALGPYSFGLGVCVGIVQNPIGAAADLVDLEKTFVLAGAHRCRNSAATARP